MERNRRYYNDLITLADVTKPDRLVDASDIDAIRRQTLGEFRNLTQSLGFLVDNGQRMLPPAQAYQWALNSSTLQIQSGAISYNQAIANAVKQLAESGIKVVDYESGHTDQIDVAARRAVMTGVAQICDKYSDQSAEYLDTRYFEITAHSGARDKTGLSPWSSHKGWQGKIYYKSKNGEPDPIGQYKDLVETTGYGYVDGLTGANCRHYKHAYIPGVMEPTYTEEQLEHIDDGLGCEFDGKKYTAYEATQMQRRLERSIRKQKRLKNAYKASGLKDEETAAAAKLRRLNTKYHDFSKAAGLPEQPERTRVQYTDAKSEAAASAAKAAKPITRLQETLDVKTEIVNGVVPKGSEIGSIREIAGGDSGKQLKVASFLSENYGGEPLQWRKMGGIIQTDNFQYDVHWFEQNGKHFEEKLKGVKRK